MKNLFKLCLVTVILISFSCNQDSLNISENSLGDDITVSKAENSKMTVDVFSPIDGVDPVGTSTLHRNKNNITVNFKTNDLIPGHAVTLWWVIWNNPENCADPYHCNDGDFARADQVNVEVLYAAGHVVGFNGQGNFSASLKVNDDSGSINDLFLLPPAGGLLDTQKAEVHLVIRTHGPKIPGEVNEQINSYVGGCDNPFLYPPFSEYPDAIGECADIIAAVHPAVQ